MLLSEDGGNSWSHIGDTPADRLLNAGRPGSNTVWAYEFDAVKGGIYESLDGGRNWRLFEEQVNAAQFQFTDPQEQPVFVATDNGIYFLSRPSAHSPVAPTF